MKSWFNEIWTWILQFLCNAHYIDIMCQVSYYFSVQCRISLHDFWCLILCQTKMLKSILCFSAFTLFCYGCGPLMKAKCEKSRPRHIKEIKMSFSMRSLHLSNQETTTVNMTWINTRIATMSGCLKVFSISDESDINTSDLTSSVKAGAGEWQRMAMTRA